jgi:hypothetical protein
MRTKAALFIRRSARSGGGNAARRRRLHVGLEAGIGLDGRAAQWPNLRGRKPRIASGSASPGGAGAWQLVDHLAHPDALLRSSLQLK